MSALCGCLGSSKSEPRTQLPAHPEAGFMHREVLPHQPPRYDSFDNGYAPIVPLPRYTPRPVSIHEKTLENNMQNHGHSRQYPDEKNQQDSEDTILQSQGTGCSSGSSATVTATMDDASSAYSFPSSFGHTSTETRDTLPPPYSSCGSSSLFSRSRASSVRSHHRSESLVNYSLQNTIQAQQTAPTPEYVPPMIAPPPMAHVHSHSAFSATNAYVPDSHRQSVPRPVQSQRRLSWESR